MERKTRPPWRRFLLPWPPPNRHGRIRQYDRILPLALKIAVPLVVISTATAVLLGGAMMAATRQSFAHTYAAEAEGIAQLVGSGYASNPNDQQAFSVFLTDIWSSVPSVRRIRLFRDDGGSPVLWASTDPSEIGRYRPGPEELSPIVTGTGVQREQVAAGEKMLETVEPIRTGGRRVVGSVGVFTSLRDRDQAVDSMAQRALVVGSLGLLADLIALWLAFSWLVLRRIARLSQAAARVATGDLDVRLPEGQLPRGTDEIFNVAREFDHMARAVASRTRQQAAVTRLGQRALQGVDLASLMDEAAHSVRRDLEVDQSAVLKLMPPGDSLSLVAGAGISASPTSSAQVPGGSGSLAGYTLELGEPVIVEDARTETRFTFPPALLEAGVGSSISVIIPGYDQPYGTFAAHTVGQRRFAEDDVQFLQAIAHTLGWAVRQRHAQEQLGEARVLEMIAKNEPLSAIFHALTEMVENQRPDALCAMLLIRDGYLYRGAGRRLPEGYLRAIDGTAVAGTAGGLAASSIRNGQSLVVGDLGGDPAWRTREATALTHGLRAGWALPITSTRGSSLGVFLTYYREPRTPTADDIRLTGTAGYLAAIAIEQRSFTERLTHQAQHDALTGLPNRILFEDRLQQALVLAKRSGDAVGVLFADLNNFKRINDTLGHGVGDMLLKHVAARLAGSVRQSDTLARMGGDEFAVVLTRLKDPRDAATVAQKVLDSLNSAFEVDGYQLFLNGSIGISLYPQDGQETAVLLRNADIAMYRAKAHSANSFQFFAPEMHAEALRRLELDNSLRRAIDNHEFRLHYQPQIDLRTGALVGAEALLRWDRPETGLVPPLQFITLAEENGLILPIGKWVLEEACRQNAAWQRMGYPPIRIAVNVSALQFARADFVQTVSETLDGTGLAPRWLELELTESLLMRDIDAVRLRLLELRKLGVAISIDDFGTGYSSLAYLQRLPIDNLKIDRTFVRELQAGDTTGPPATLIRTILSLAHNLGMRVLAEGVETTGQYEFLRDAACELGQGYFFGKPMPPEEMPVIMATLSPGSHQAA